MESEKDPIRLFAKLYELYRQQGVAVPSAMVLATASPEGKPSARVVLLREFDAGCFVFYTNFASRKARELNANPYAALCFYWEPIDYQVRVEGTVQHVSEPEADAYFAKRPRGSQIGAWASRQSSVLTSRSELEQRFRDYETRFAGQDVPRPDFWSGFHLVPDSIEFWKRRENRLHNRTRYQKTGEGWSVQYLYP
ncbi:MAG: pyridoxamine 5'-phosphate oxidase [Desulfobacterales bacterium]|jgi:pyridoxamine 5'-phosphate oxidase|nr:pyridoxamine 5'-phosphate oxidase [Desulfobacterales bacterium]